jgi:hypothetical protein
MFKLPRVLTVLAATMLGLAVVGLAEATTSAPGAKVYFINLKNGDTVTSPFLVQFGLSGMGISPAGVENQPLTAHHHLLVGTKLTDEELKGAIPVDAKHLHFGKGQTETTLTLAPGTYTLQLVLGDWSHVPHDQPLMSEIITITVK